MNSRFVAITLTVLTALILVVTSKVNSPPANDGESTQRLDVVENKIQDIDDRLNEISDLFNQNSSIKLENKIEGIDDRLNEISGLLRQNPSIIADSFIEPETITDGYGVKDLLDNEAGALDPLSTEGIALENEAQNRYISQVSEMYYVENLDPEWANAVETEVLPKLVDIENFRNIFASDLASERGANVPSGAPDISVSTFECRSQICSTEVITGSMKEMLAYQNYMVQQTKSELPSIVFSTIEPFGSKFSMKAFLARDEFDFPAPRQ